MSDHAQRRTSGLGLGKYRFDVLSMQAHEQDFAHEISILGETDVRSEVVGDLMARSGDHPGRIAAGDVALGYYGGEAFLGVVWLNLFSHVDLHGGKWARPDDTTAYLNQLLVLEEHRGTGIGNELVKAVISTAARSGRQRVRVLIHPGNVASRHVFARNGAILERRLFGLRVAQRYIHIGLPALGNES